MALNVQKNPNKREKKRQLLITQINIDNETLTTTNQMKPKSKSVQ